MNAAFIFAVLLQAAPPPVPDEPPPRFSSDVDVVARTALTVEEVIARHQAAARRQGERLRGWIATGKTVIVFQAPGVSAPVTISSDTIVFAGPGVDEMAQRDIRMNGASVPIRDDGIPRLPIIEPERVAAPPLIFDSRYRYRLLDPDTADGERCYVVGFEPTRAGASLMAGRAWISATDFGLVRMDATQTGLRGPIVSSRQRDDFRPLEVQGQRVWVLGRSEVRQVYEGPGHRTPIDRVMTLAGYDPNPLDFDERRREAHASPAVLMARTAEGFRYLRRAAAPARPEATAASPAMPLRTVAGRATRIWTVAAGLLVDPNIDHPLPFAGVGYLDLDLFGSGTQLNAFAAGPFLQLAWSAPGRTGRRTLVQARAFASLVEYNDRAFRDGIERYEENVRQRPASLTVELVHPAGSTRFRAAYELAAARLRRGSSTAPDFIAPAAATAHGLRLAIDRPVAGWNVSAWASGARRSSWHEWGFAGNEDSRPEARGFEKAGVTAARAFVLGARAVAHADLVAMAGRDLDRFSRFTFDGLDNRLHGSPSAAVRFDRGVVARSALSVAVSRVIRANAFADLAVVRDPAMGPGHRTVPGFGAAAELRLPRSALLNVEWGYGPEARNQDGRRGAHVLRITAFKVI